MSLGKRLFTEGAAVCLTETTDIFGGSTGKALYSMDFDASSQDGTVDATPTNVDFGVSGRTVNSARFNGSSSKIDLPDILPANSNADSSFTCWFRTSDTSGNQMTIVNAWNGSTTANNGGWALFKDAGNTFFFTQYYLKSSASGLTGGTAVGDGNWHFVAVVFDYSAGTLSLYLDGNSTPHLQHTSLTPGTVNIFNGGAELGYQKPGGPFRYWNGDIDQVRIFSKALSTSEISTLYNSGNGETACVHTATTTSNIYPVANTMYHKLDNSAVDEIGTATSTEQQMQYRFGKYGQAALFNGLNNGSEINTNYTTGDTALTHSIWMNQSGMSAGGFNVVLGRYWDGNTPLHLGYYMWTNTTTVNWRVFFGGVGGTTSQHVEASGTITQNKWHHIVATWTDGTGAKLYIDGSLAQSVSSSETRNKNGIALALGAFGHNRSNQANFKGLLDTHRYFNSELTSTQVTQLFNEKPETDTSNFKCVLYEGTGSTQYISNVGMDLETSGGLLWTKRRTGSDVSYAIVDSVRGIATSGSNYIASDRTDAEASSTNMPSSLEKNGFFVQGSGGRTNTNGEDYVSWVFKAGGATSGNSVGDISSQVSLNSTLGFSIVSYTGDANMSNTIGHGLKIGTTETRPDLIIVKNRTATNNPSWAVWSSVFTSSSETLQLNSNALSNAISDRFGTITTTTFKGGASGNNEVNGANPMIAYCFASVTGLSKISSYNGDSSSNLGVSTVGFKPSLLVIKKFSGSGTGHWMVYDNRRDTANAPQTDTCLFWNLDDPDFSASDINVRFDDDGFTVLGNNSNINGAGNSYLYIAFK